ncbi:MAG: group I intron-associated PD-(D/E)XK endonuclease [Thermoleophilaceae bacterium]
MAQRQGDLGEASALEWLVSKGASVFVPFGHSPNCDLVAEIDGCLLRIQVKTSRCRKSGGYGVQLSTRGGNQSWSGVSKLFDQSRFDYLLVVINEGRRWCIPAREIAARHSIIVGGTKWARFEVEPGRPLVDAPSSSSPRGLESVPAPGGAPELESRAGL